MTPKAEALVALSHALAMLEAPAKLTALEWATLGAVVAFARGQVMAIEELKQKRRTPRNAALDGPRSEEGGGD